MAEFKARSLVIPGGLPSSDYFLYQQGQEFFNFNSRQLMQLGLRVLYAGLHGQINRQQILDMATSLQGETRESPKPTYRKFSSIPS